LRTEVGDHTAGVTPVPMWESRSSPALIKAQLRNQLSLFRFGKQVCSIQFFSSLLSASKTSFSLPYCHIALGQEVEIRGHRLWPRPRAMRRWLHPPITTRFYASTLLLFYSSTAGTDLINGAPPLPQDRRGFSAYRSRVTAVVVGLVVGDGLQASARATSRRFPAGVRCRHR
jgi:hypothetical protein